MEKERKSPATISTPNLQTPKILNRRQPEKLRLPAIQDALSTFYLLSHSMISIGDVFVIPISRQSIPLLPIAPVPSNLQRTESEST